MTDTDRFRGYLASLGLRDYDGTAKSALSELRARAATRDWLTN